uniref:Uncharacterized protein n=1 Tax=Anguilla anguilla TaxID=7936 RepID=A0A0E9THC8_ANGAN
MDHLIWQLKLTVCTFISKSNVLEYRAKTTKIVSLSQYFSI